MSLLDDIRGQHPHIREIFMWLCVVITFSVVSFFWVKTEAKQIAILVNPKDHATELAKKSDPKNQSLFATMSSSFGNLKASLGELTGISKNSAELQSQAQPTEDVEPHLFPLSRNK